MSANGAGGRAQYRLHELAATAAHTAAATVEDDDIDGC
jgi:hypothetical protein